MPNGPFPNPANHRLKKPISYFAKDLAIVPNK